MFLSLIYPKNINTGFMLLNKIQPVCTRYRRVINKIKDGKRRG